MRIDSSDRIAGHPAVAVRKLLRSGRDRSWNLDLAGAVLETSSKDAAAAIAELVRLGYVHKATDASSTEGDWFANTTAGNALANATAARPILRGTAEKALDEFLDRVRAVNADPYYLFRIEYVVVFGSYLSSAAKVNDVDVAVTLAAKEAEKEKRITANQRRINEALAAGRRFQNLTAEVSWPRTEVLLKLKSRSRTISLHDLESDAEIIRSGPFDVIYAAPGMDQLPPKLR